MAGNNPPEATHASHPNYVKIWGVLVVLLIASVAGPMIASATMSGHVKTAFVLITAFGIALVKAYLVAVNFMHVRVEPKIVMFIVAVMLGCMVLLWAGVAPDVQRHQGVNWDNISAKEEIKRALSAGAKHAGDGKAHEGAAH